MTMEKVNIRKEGSVVENLFRKITGATKPPRTSDGNASLDGHFIAIAKVGKDNNTLNQVRAVKYLPLVAYDEPNGIWYVIPAHVLVRAAAAKDRGQHGEIPFECVNLSLKKFATRKVPPNGHLKSLVLQAVSESAKYPELKRLMNQVVKSAAALGEKSRTDVRTLMAKLNVPPR